MRLAQRLIELALPFSMDGRIPIVGDVRAVHPITWAKCQVAPGVDDDSLPRVQTRASLDLTQRLPARVGQFYFGAGA